MAITRKKSIYIEEKNKSDAKVQAITAVMLIFAIFIYHFTKSKNETIAIVIICFICISFLFRNKDTYDYKMNINKIVSKELSKLNNKYIVYNDILIGEDGNNINHLVLSKFGIFFIQLEENGIKNILNSILSLLSDNGLEDVKVYPIIISEKDKCEEIDESEDLTAIEPRKIISFINSKKEKIIDKNNIKLIEEAIKNN